jgi:thiamine-phosphate pyrophosphorylase
MKPLPRLYAIADGSFGNPVGLAAELYAAGVGLVQLRNKTAGSGLLLEQASRIASSAPPDALLVVNDRADVALLAGAGGVHLGQEDLTASSVRAVVGDDLLVGASTHGMAQALAAVQGPIDYIAVGPVFETPTKTNPSPVVGLKELENICAAVDIPVVAIGGIHLGNVGEVLKTGARSVAVIADLIGRGKVRERAYRFLEKLERFDDV